MRTIALALFTAACSIRSATFTPSDAVLPGGIEALVILQRSARDTGDVFQAGSYQPGARLVKLSPPAPGGELTPLCCAQLPELANADISSFDVAFDAGSIVVSARASEAGRYGLYLLKLDDGSVTPITSDAGNDYLSPIFLPDRRVMFTTTAVVEAGAPQFVEDDGDVATQLGTIGTDGTGLQLGPRHLSARSALSLASDGRVVFTQRDRLGPGDGGNLMFVDQNMQELHEGFGKQGSGVSRATTAAREISPGRFIAVATAHTGTLQAGALIDIRLGDLAIDGDVVSAAANASEKHATTQMLTPDVPVEAVPSRDGIGRYHDAYPLDAKNRPALIVSWADGPVTADALASAEPPASFGIYLYDSEHHDRALIFDDPDRWDVLAQPLRPRSVPPTTGGTQDPELGAQTLIGSLDAYQSSLTELKPGSLYGVRVLEGFSHEEGFPLRFGSTGFEGNANLGIAPLASGAWSAKIPANIPVRLQSVDVFGMARFSESVWISGRAGETMICGGCHEDRAHPVPVSSVQRDRLLRAALPLMSTTPRSQRRNRTPASADAIVGVGWDSQLQPIFDNNCIACHDSRNVAGVKPYTIAYPDGRQVIWTFDLSGGQLPPDMAAVAGGTYSNSYFSLLGPDPAIVDREQLTQTGNVRMYVQPGNAQASLVIQLLNPTQIFPSPTPTRAFPTVPHLPDLGRPDLSALDDYLLILAIDMGATFYARENAPALH